MRTSRDCLGSRVQGWTILTNSCWLALRTWKLRLSPVCLQHFRDPHSISRNIPQGYGDCMGVEDRGQESVHCTVHTLRIFGPGQTTPRIITIVSPHCRLASSLLVHMNQQKADVLAHAFKRFANRSQTVVWCSGHTVPQIVSSRYR